MLFRLRVERNILSKTHSNSDKKEHFQKDYIIVEI